MAARAGLQEQHLLGRIFAQPRRQGAARRTRAHDDVVVIGHDLGLLPHAVVTAHASLDQSHAGSRANIVSTGETPRGPISSPRWLGSRRRSSGKCSRMLALVRIALRRPYTFVVLALLI